MVCETTVSGQGKLCANENIGIENGEYGNSSACNCALAAQLAANELEQPGIRPFAAGKF